MLDFAAKIPNIPIPFHKLLKVVALVDGSNPHAGALIERLRGEGLEVEVSSRYDRDVAEDSEVGAYIASVMARIANWRARWRKPSAIVDSKRRYGRSPTRATSPMCQWSA